MTNDQLEAIYKQNLGTGSTITALKAVYTQGWYDGKGQTPAATGVTDKVAAATAPTVIVKIPHSG